MKKLTSNKDIDLIFTCEHGGHEVPSQLKYLEKLTPLNFDSHQTWDQGALEVTRFLAKKLHADYFANTASRLLIDCNRSDDNPTRFPPWTRQLTSSQRRQIESEVFLNYKSRVRARVKKSIKSNLNVIVVSVHSFTPTFKGSLRKTDLGVLFRPSNPNEAEFGIELRDHLKNFSDFRIHLNMPYRGHTDCFLNELSSEFESSQSFLGIMIELNFGLRRSKKQWNELQWALAVSLAAILGF